MTVSREDQDADKQPVWTSPCDRLVQRYRYHRSDSDARAKGPLAMAFLFIASLLALVGLSSK